MATVSAAAKEIIEKKGYKEADLIDLVDNCGDERIYNTETKLFIAKKEVGDITLYAVFNEAKEIVSAYSHKMKILDIVLEGEEETPWVYCKNKKHLKAGHTNLTYLGATRSGPSLTEPESGSSWFEQYLADGALTTAETLFQQKRA